MPQSDLPLAGQLRSAPSSHGHDLEAGHSVHGKGNATRWRWQYLGFGVASLLWLVLRTGTSPQRMAYPCQQAAAASSLGFLQYVASLLASTALFRCIKGRWAVVGGGLLVAGLACIAVLRMSGPQPATLAAAGAELPSWTSPSAVSDVFAVRNVPIPRFSLDGGTVPAGVLPADALHDDGVDALLNLMESHGTYFYKTGAHPMGIVGPGDVVVIKINDQWNGEAARARTHTNNDVLKGLIYRIVQHPYGFSGAVVVAENTQWTDPNWDSPDHNNAQDAHQSYQDVVSAFTSQGYNVCISDWRSFSSTFVGEFSTGDSRDGYVLVDDPGQPGTDQLSYPKFNLTCGSQSFHISMRHGLWDGVNYDNTRLKMINLPVLKRHGWAGATIAVKNHIGFLTTADTERRFGSSDEMHGFFWGYNGIHADYGLLGRQMARIRRADLNIVDAIWVAKDSNKGGCPDSCIRQDVLLASTDPFALDYYASVNVLAPLTPSRSLRNILRNIINRSSANDASAAYRNGRFRNLLLCNENRLRLEGATDIIDLDDSYSQAQEEAQFNVYVADASPQARGPSEGIGALAHATGSRVVWVLDEDATNWDYGDDYYGREEYVDQDVVNSMTDQGLMALTGSSSVAEAWRRLIPNYVSGQTIAIKINLNCNFDRVCAQRCETNCDYDELRINALPQPVNALIRGLKQIGVAEEDVWVYEASRPIEGRVMERITNLYPGVRFFDTLDCRENAGWGASVVEFYPPEGIPRPRTQNLSNVLVNVDYLINMPIMKRHVGAGVTLSFKNHFGSIRKCYELHAWVYGEGGDNYSSAYNPLVDLYRNPHIGDKTILLVGDGLYGDRRSNVEKPERWETFGWDSPNSLLFSTDPVAIDSVMTDILHAEGHRGGVVHWADDYLELAAGEGLGVYERGDPWKGSEGYARIDFIRCEDSVCPGASPFPSPTSTSTPGSTSTPTNTPTQTPVEGDDYLYFPLIMKERAF